MASENKNFNICLRAEQNLSMHIQGKAFYIQRDKIEIITWIHVSEFYIH